MTTTTNDKIHAPTTTTTTTTKRPSTTTTTGKFPPPSSATRRRQAPPHRCHDNHHHRRSHHTCRCCCLWLLWVLLILAALLVLAAIPAAVFYAIYRPRPPSFNLSSLKVSQLNLNPFVSRFNVTLVASNPNDKIIFYYDHVNVTLVYALQEGVVVGRGFYPSFVHWSKNTTFLLGVIKSSGNDVDHISDPSLERMRSDLRNKKGLDLKLEMVTQMRVKIGDKMKTSNKVCVRVYCDGIIKVFANSKGKLSVKIIKSDITGDGVKCKVHFSIKIFQWEVPILI